MIVQLAGKLLAKVPDHIVLDVGGVGYQVWITLGVYEVLPPTGADVHLLTYHHIRDDTQELYGFTGEEERELFKLLITVSGIGARTAIGILSGVSARELRQRIQEEQPEALTVISGIGPKIARRIVAELRDRVADLAAGDGLADRTSAGAGADNFAQAVQSLQALGFKQREAREAVRSALKRVDDDAPVEELIRAALSRK